MGLSVMFFNARTRAFTQPNLNNSPAKRLISEKNVEGLSPAYGPGLHPFYVSLYFFAFGRLAPYLERRCVRLATPAVSSVPRTM